ncbi:DNA polymerase III subunit beta [Romboutsia sp. 1001285H_161024_C4]|uniref:DNA polymerase III subunit beta n=1 Tax=Romboutsia sp. 1001285H_161024_C4 TaxID=2787109 RepID=UPI00189BC71E|nr:DNA polymerase III subunit beta [Romboutsia sp. 1001285H_161024_C4]
MKVAINSSLFNDFVKQSKIVSDTFEGILIDATNENVELVKCDLDNQITTKMQADIEEPGSVILPKEVFPLVKDNSLMTILDDRLIIGSRVIKLDLKSGKNYPTINGDFEHEIFEMSHKELKQLLQVEHAISKDATKPILNGIRIDKDRFIAIDGYKLAERTGNFKSDIPITISNYKMLKALKGNIKATASTKYIKYQVGEYNFYNRLIEGDFIEVDYLKPKEYNTKFKINKKDILEILKSMEKISATHKNQLVMFTITNNVIHISAKDDKISLEDSVICETEEHLEDVSMGFNCKYLIDSIKNMDDVFSVELTTNVNPIILKSPGKYDLILPVRVAKI